jgi:class 3 adenylate cyclase
LWDRFTERAVAIGDHSWRELLAASVQRETLRNVNAREVNTAGDGFLAVFDGPARSAAQARSAEQRVRSALFAAAIRWCPMCGQKEHPMIDHTGIGVIC